MTLSAAGGGHHLPARFDPVGRDNELATIGAFLAVEEPRARVLLLIGEAGIGKTTLWRVGVEAAADSGHRVLSCSALGAETQFTFTCLRDLVGEVFDEVSDELAPPQRRALAAALLREEPADRPPDPGAVAVAFRSVLRALVRQSPVVVAVDDAQWLDAASATALRYALRRLKVESVAVLITRRSVLHPRRRRSW